MDRSEGVILMMAGILLLGIGFYFFLYSEWNWIWGTQYPYRGEGTIGIIIGFLLLAAGVKFISSAPLSKQRAEIPKPPVTRFCPQCGSPLTKEERFCHNCGKPLET